MSSPSLNGTVRRPCLPKGWVPCGVEMDGRSSTRTGKFWARRSGVCNGACCGQTSGSCRFSRMASGVSSRRTARSWLSRRGIGLRRRKKACCFRVRGPKVFLSGPAAKQFSRPGLGKRSVLCGGPTITTKPKRRVLPKGFWPCDPPTNGDLSMTTAKR